MAIDRSSLRKSRQDLRKKRYDLRPRYTEVPKVARKTRPRRRRAPPPEDLSDKKIADDSREAALYARNQQESPLLRLPAEIRTIIYEHVLGGTTIHVRSRPKLSSRTLGPFTCSRGSDTTTSLTLLNNVCRQLYKETAVLPYKLNIWSFKYAETLKLFSRQKDLVRPPHPYRAIESALVFNIPPPSTITHMGGLKFVLTEERGGITRYRIEKRKGRWHTIRAGRVILQEGKWNHELLTNAHNPFNDVETSRIYPWSYVGRRQLPYKPATHKSVH